MKARPFGRRGPVPRRQPSLHLRCFPVLEALEARCLLSASYYQLNLASDIPGLAAYTDPNLRNPWGISASPTGPFWFSENNAGVSDLVQGNGQAEPLVVTIPSANGGSGSPTGTVFNDSNDFVVSKGGVSGPAVFLFATEDGTIAGWNPAVDPTQAIVEVNNSHPYLPEDGAVYKGLVIGVDSDGESLLYATNFNAGTVDVFGSNFQPVQTAGGFRDPSIPKGYAPFGIQNIDDRIFVTYAQQDGQAYDDVPGAGHGFVDVFSTDGVLEQRFASRGVLDSPWGVTQAPAGFGAFSGDILIGNLGDGHINAFNPVTGAYLGALTNAYGSVITINNLWGLSFGNGHAAGSTNVLYFTAGIDNEQHGLYGAIVGPEGAAPVDLAGTKIYSPNDPDDSYPLPPASGPTLSLGADLLPPPTSALVPSTRSSLALAPTFLAVAERIVSVGTTPTDAVSVASATSAFDDVQAPSVASAFPGGSLRNQLVALNPYFGHDAALDSAGVATEPLASTLVVTDSFDSLSEPSASPEAAHSKSTPARVAVSERNADPATTTKAELGQMLSDPYLFPAGSLPPGDEVTRLALLAPAALTDAEVVSWLGEEASTRPGTYNRVIPVTLLVLASPFLLDWHFLSDGKKAR